MLLRYTVQNTLPSFNNTMRTDTTILIFCFHTYGKTVVEFFKFNRKNLPWNSSQRDIPERMRNTHRVYILFYSLVSYIKYYAFPIYRAWFLFIHDIQSYIYTFLDIKLHFIEINYINFAYLHFAKIHES
jgi:hypothetical protein